MPTASAILNFYIDLNVLVLVAVPLWLGVAAALRLAGLRDAVTLKLAVLRRGFAAVLLAAAVAALLGAVSPATGRTAGYNVTDFVVAQYLQGRFAMDPFLLERLLVWRAELVAELMAPRGWALAMACLLLAGAVLHLVRLAVAGAKLRRMMAESWRWRRLGGVDLHLSDRLAVPFSALGLRGRHVVLPSSLLERERDLRIAVAHELQHLRQGDVEWEIAVQLLRPLLFWNPAFLLWQRRVEVLRELACDRRLVARRRLDVAEYCRCLLRVCRDGMTPRRLFAVQMPVVGLIPGDGRSPRNVALLKARMEALVEGRADVLRPRLAVALILPLAGLTLAAALALRPSGDWSPDRLMLSTILNLERLEALNATVPSLAVPGW
jgi:hypothetical protein